MERCANCNGELRLSADRKNWFANTVIQNFISMRMM